MPKTRKAVAVSVEPGVDLYMSIHQAAAALGRAHATIRTMALKKELGSAVVAGRVVITRESVQEYLDRNGFSKKVAR
jgi:hypothetical protein